MSEALAFPVPEDAPTIHDARCPSGHVFECEECREAHLTALDLHGRRQLAKYLRELSQGSTYLWVDGRYHGPSKVHLLDCPMVDRWFDYPLGPIGDYMSHPYAELTERGVRHVVERYHFLDHYPGDMPICGHCEKRMG